MTKRVIDIPFHSVTIRGVTFEGTVTRLWPMLDVRCGERRGHSPLGYCTTLQRRPADHHGPAGLWIAKYRTQKRFLLPDLDPEELAVLEDEFGLTLHDAKRQDCPVCAFYDSRAADGLIAWTQRHPWSAARWRHTTNYLGDWSGWCRHTAAAREILENARRGRTPDATPKKPSPRTVTRR